MYFTTEEILKALREGATDADIANQFTAALNEASKLHTEETVKAKAEKEVLYANCADAFNAVLKAEGIGGDDIDVDDIHEIVDTIKNAGTFLEKLLDDLSSAFSDKASKRGRKPTADKDEDIIKSFLASLS